MLAAHEDKLFDALGTHLVAFGEWCAARHSLDYATLPDWWMLFDVYDRQEQRFWSTTRRNAMAMNKGPAYSGPTLHGWGRTVQKRRLEMEAVEGKYGKRQFNKASAAFKFILEHDADYNDVSERLAQNEQAASTVVLSGRDTGGPGANLISSSEGVETPQQGR